MTLIEVRSGSGRLVGRCDARCYNARSKGCHCVCHGRNHGKGLEVARREMTDDAIRVGLLPEVCVVNRTGGGGLFA